MDDNCEAADVNEPQEPPGRVPPNQGLHRRTILGYASASALAAATLALTAKSSPAIGAEKKDGIVKLLALGDPVGWDGHLNGQVPLEKMTLLTYPDTTNPYQYDGSLQAVYMRPDAAVDLVAWLTAYSANFGTYLKVNEGYRTLKGQNYWWNQYGQNPNLAARPGRSNHGLGQAVDFERSEIPEGSQQLAWLRRTCGSYGFAVYSSERWHFDYTRAWSPGQATPTPLYLPQEEDEDMYARRSNGEVAIFGASYRSVKGGGTGRHIFGSPDEYNAWRSLVVSHNTTVDAASKRPVPPELSKVMNVDDLGWGVLNAIYGT